MQNKQAAAVTATPKRINGRCQKISMSKLTSKPDIILDKVLAYCPNGKLLSDEQIDDLVALCDPPAQWLRESIALEFERAALVLFSGRTIIGQRAKRLTFRNQLSAIQRNAKKLHGLLEKLNPELKAQLGDQFTGVPADRKHSIGLLELENLLENLSNLSLPKQAGGKSDVVIVWVVDGLNHAIETRLIPDFNLYGERKRGIWFSTARKAKLISAFLKSADHDNKAKYTVGHIDYLLNRGNAGEPPGRDLRELTDILKIHQTSDRKI